MLLTEARRPARTGADGELIPLAEQDRTRWDREAHRRGRRADHRSVANGGGRARTRCRRRSRRCTTRPPRHADTDWREILALYGLLERMTGNPMVSLNRAIAAAMADGPGAGLAYLKPLEERLVGHQRLHSVRAHLLEMDGRIEDAIEDYEAAARRTANVPEQQYLMTCAARLRHRDA